MMAIPLAAVRKSGPEKISSRDRTRMAVPDDRYGDRMTLLRARRPGFRPGGTRTAGPSAVVARSRLDSADGSFIDFFPGRAGKLADDLPALHDHCPVGKCGDLFRFVRDDDGGGAIGGSPADLLVNLVSGPDVNSPGG